MKTIESIKIEREMDQDPDLSYLGEFHYGPRKKFDISNGDDSWYTPAQFWPHNPKNWENVPPKNIEQTIKEFGSLRKADYQYAIADMKRLLNYYHNNWHMIYIRATTEIKVSDDGIHWAHETLRIGCGGIETDSGEEYINEITSDLLSELDLELTQWGFSRTEITEKMKGIKHEN